MDAQGSSVTVTTCWLTFARKDAAPSTIDRDAHFFGVRLVVTTDAEDASNRDSFESPTHRSGNDGWCSEH